MRAPSVGLRLSPNDLADKQSAAALLDDYRNRLVPNATVCWIRPTDGNVSPPDVKFLFVRPILRCPHQLHLHCLCFSSIRRHLLVIVSKLRGWEIVPKRGREHSICFIEIAGRQARNHSATGHAAIAICHRPWVAWKIAPMAPTQWAIEERTATRYRRKLAPVHFGDRFAAAGSQER